MSVIFVVTLFAGGLFLGMLLFQEAGRRLGERRLASDPEQARAGLGAVEGAVFALMGLLIAFSFSGAESRFDERRHLVVQEANAIGTAYLRLDLLPADAQPKMRDLFRRYLDARLEAYRSMPDLSAAMAALTRSFALQGDIWRGTLEASRSEPQARILLVPALNEMFDITTTRTAAFQMHPPPIIFGMLGLVALVCALFAGYAMAGSKSRSLVHSVGFVIILSLTVYVILDLEFPRMGLIRVDAMDQVLADLRESMK
jgi:hypothetical protein